MKWLKYRKVVATVNVGTEENPEMQYILQDMGLQYSQANEQIVKEIAFNGEYTIEDDGQPESEQQLTDAQRIAELEEALEMLLSGVTE